MHAGVCVVWSCVGGCEVRARRLECVYVCVCVCVRACVCVCAKLKCFLRTHVANSLLKLLPVAAVQRFDAAGQLATKASNVNVSVDLCNNVSTHPLSPTISRVKC